MGELARALRDPRTRSSLKVSGDDRTYSDPVELGEDMVALKRAFPDVRLLVSDDPLRQEIGYLGYRTEGDREVVFYFRLPLGNCRAWESGPLTGTQAALAECFRTADGRRRLIQVVEEAARRPEARPETLGSRRSVWDRLKDDDEPL